MKYLLRVQNKSALSLGSVTLAIRLLGKFQVIQSGQVSQEFHFFRHGFVKQRTVCIINVWGYLEILPWLSILCFYRNLSTLAMTEKIKSELMFLVFFSGSHWFFFLTLYLHTNSREAHWDSSTIEQQLWATRLMNIFEQPVTWLLPLFTNTKMIQKMIQKLFKYTRHLLTTKDSELCKT